MTYDDINQMMVSYHNNIFGVEYLFDKEISREKLAAWLSVEAEVRKYTLMHSKDIFGTSDPVLTSSLEKIEKANKSLTDAIETTYIIKDNTPNLIKMAALFHVIENQMKKVIEELKGTSFILRRKKKAQALLTNFALFIELTAKKAQKDTRMGHRKDVFLSKTHQINMPKKQFIPLLPPSDMPPVYQE